jgi:hypothetical protein
MRFCAEMLLEMLTTSKNLRWKDYFPFLSHHNEIIIVKASLNISSLILKLASTMLRHYFAELRMEITE